MCTSIVVNKNKTVVGWNLDILGMEHRVRVADRGVYIEINDATEGWMPIFGANSRGEFVGMPTCWPADARSDPKPDGGRNLIMLDADLLLEKKTFADTKRTVETEEICSVPGLTFMASLSDCEGNLLHVVPGQGFRYYVKPSYRVLTNFSPFKGDAERHPWMGLDRYNKANEILGGTSDGFDVKDMFGVLKAVSQTECPTTVSMVYDVTERTVYYCEYREWDKIRCVKFDILHGGFCESYGKKEG